MLLQARDVYIFNNGLEDGTSASYGGGHNIEHYLVEPSLCHHFLQD